MNQDAGQNENAQITPPAAGKAHAANSCAAGGGRAGSGRGIDLEKHAA